ncbi:unnamed protein product [Adineta steineri]|uniref:Uncharacterized protein n=1 Tax=Adineta steineri TaxID=433720 RepID=A0A814H5C7_9BILA|nr:unnamed protein product [Adineta steineri]CAF1437981.1 unnamed protein product [Adineta steineri]
MLKREVQSIQQNGTFNKKKIVKAPPFYNVHNDTFYHGPAWVIKPRLFQPKENHIKKPGPGYYNIPDRSLYERPGKTIGSRYETNPPISTYLLAHYYPNDQYISNTRMPTISITPRRIKHEYQSNYSRRFYTSSNLISHRQTPLLRPLYGPAVSRKPLDQNFSSISPGPAAYPMYEYDEDVLPRPQPGFTQKHRFVSNRDRSTVHTSPPFYYSDKTNRYQLPSFTIGKRLLSSKKVQQCAIPYYTPFNDKALCSRITQPGITLKGRWSSAVYMGIHHKPKV